MLDTGEFRTYFRSELVSAGMDPTFFDHMWITSRGEVADVEREVQKSNKERFTLLRNYLDAETAHTREQEKVLKNMYQNIPLLSENLPRAFYTSDRENIATKAHEKYSASLTNPSLSSPSFESDDSSLIRSFR